MEVDYLTTLSDAVPLDAWKRIATRAVSDAEKGDAKARAWLSGYLLPARGSQPTVGSDQESLSPDDHQIEVEFRRDWYGGPVNRLTAP